jgi:nicotinate-nucleotide adenylyltransferase
MKKKAIFGGTFDPIHVGHLYIASRALYDLDIDEVVFMPSGNPPHKKNSNITDAYLRYEMVKTASKYEPRFIVSNFEVDKKKPCYTYETIEAMRLKEPDTKWYFLSGADCLMELNTWKNVDRILKICNLIVFNRPGYIKDEIIAQKNKIEDRYNTEILFLDIPLLDISSTGIRNAIKEGKNMSCLLSEGVWNTIRELNLYT